MQRVLLHTGKYFSCFLLLKLSSKNFRIYTVYVENWLKYISPENILFIEGEEIIHNPHLVFLETQKFLKIENHIKKDDFVKNNKVRLKV